MDNFNLNNDIVIITGGAGLLGRKHAEAVIEGNGTAVLLDISETDIERAVSEMSVKYGDGCAVDGYVIDITNRSSVEELSKALIEKYGHIDVLINNAANNPKVEGNASNMKAIQFENFPLEMWENDIAVGLTGALICSQVFGEVMAGQGKGVVLNISSDLGIIAPDQRIYRKEGLHDDEQTIKPVTYSVIKHGLIGLTKYLATYYAQKGVRANALCPAGVYNGQNDEFLGKLTNLIPMGRMADVEEYKSTILYLISDASSYMTGSTVIVDGGRTCW
jgi:NAD(P)-dependent dehydrogenase (short-subunit alcohol dehydrogenase family)